MVFPCRESAIVPIGQGGAVGTVFSMHVDGSGDFDNGAFTLDRTDPAMRALIERAHELDCGTMAVHPREAEFNANYGADWRQTYDVSCLPTTCQIAIDDHGTVQLTERP